MKNGRPRFLLTANLNRLARWLRMLGYDAAVYKSISRQKQIDLANKERRILVTRCRKTANLKQRFSRFLILNDNHIKQLKELSDYLKIDESCLFSRCSNCNKMLVKISKKKIEHLIPKFVFENFDEFKLCRNCGHIYWQGSHYQKIKQELLETFSPADLTESRSDKLPEANCLENRKTFSSQLF